MYWGPLFDYLHALSSSLASSLESSFILSYTTMENATFNQTNDGLTIDCPEIQEGILASFSFWIEGITQVNIAMIGIIFNLVSMVILMDKEMRNRYVHIRETSPQKLWHEDALWFEIFF